MEGGLQLGLNLKTILPHQEYLLQGSILDSCRDVLVHRLRGLCDSPETGPEQFHDHEMVFIIRGTSPQPIQPILFRARKALDHPECPWHLRYLGQVEDKRHTLVRSCLDVGCSDSVVQFLNEMGFRLDHEYVVKGFVFRKGRMKVTVSKIYRLHQPGNTEAIEALSLSSLVEMSVVAPAGQDQLQEDMKNFSDQLKPIIQLERIDHRRLQIMSESR